MRNVKYMTPRLTPNFPQTNRNDVQPHDFLTYELFYACNYWHMKPCLSALFEQSDGLWGVFTVKKHNVTQRFDLQGHARVQIFTYKDVSVCNVSPNFPMFYDNCHVSTQISRLCHVHAQVYTLTDMSSHTFLSYGDVSEYSLALSFPLLRLVRRNY